MTFPNSITRHPLTDEQRRLWFLQQLHPEDSGFNMYLNRRWSGPIDPGALSSALTRLTARHGVLRTRFALDGERPVQLVEPVRDVELTLIPIPDAVEESFTAACAPFVNAPFDLGARPPLRAVLVSAGEHEHALSVVVHHIVSDGWSFTVLWRELLALYREEIGEGAAELPQLKLQFGDYALAERARLDGGAAEEAVRHWSGRLAGVSALRMPLDHPRPADPAHPAGFADLALGPDLVAGLDALAREQRCTPFMVLLAAYQSVLARWSGSYDFAVGTPLAGRNETTHEALLGYFSRTGVIRADLTGEPGFRTVLRRVRSATMAALSHQDVPVERVAAELGLPVLPGVGPLYQAVFVHQSQYDLAGADERTALPAGVRTASMDSGFDRAKTDLLLDSWRTPDGGMTLSFCFDRELFERATVEALARRIRDLLARAVVDVEVPLHGDWLLADGERAALLALGAGPAVAEGDARPVLRGFADQVAARPDAPAVECAGSIRTYAELDRASADLAGRLGPVAGRAVGVRIEPSFELVIALLAIWKAGAGYLPLDPAHPAERQRLMLGEADAALLLTGGERPDLGVPVLAVGDPDTGAGQAGAQPARAAQAGAGHAGAVGIASGSAGPAGAALPGTDPRGLAYVLYTSGSTGAPKGVAVEHAALAERVRWMAGPEGYGLRPGDRIVQFASIGFDTHAEEIWPALTAGACVVLLPGGGLMLPDLLRSEAGRSVTVLDLPTAYWQELVSLADRTPWPPALRLVVLGGSEARAVTLAQWRERHGDTVRLVNTYGPTEATVIVTAGELTGGPGGRPGSGQAAEERPPLGRPLPGVRLYLLDEHGSLLPAGSEGELYIGGSGLARGYLARPELTAEAFLPDPFADAPDGRMYRTGDRARWRTDGQLEFLGRSDDQVKIRGYRIEPAEIEAALTAHPAVGRVAVLVRDGRRLIAYAVLRPAAGQQSAAAPPAGELREYLALRLPAFMVPDAVVLLDTLPLTANGKLDAAALPDPEPAGAAAGYLAPRTDAEALVVDLWQEVLGVPKVGVLDDFLALGGDSLLVTRVAARIRAGVGVDVSIRDVFESPTPAALAARIEAVLIAEIDALSEEEAAGRLD
ncbi:amino acid adenylation domain-containing protein [Streptomyces antarcticus]|uniref:amino acid adenylation domain-containing protein n=1 Tax=Streptomyces antarcticus TaxID=2996458 RepID=UPI00226D73C8|nr:MULTISPECIES: amino acid adenylation domain-containing protein [unclassified Streptomyces]MCY0939901.1 amino acid adenylation domain-containing protein [Streptomyces sp. H34-AA3]MCZ4081071.1 amino acid adenylation domain-containing protein [Streptomyces sp. H34-S5]